MTTAITGCGGIPHSSPRAPGTRGADGSPSEATLSGHVRVAQFSRSLWHPCQACRSMVFGVGLLVTLVVDLFGCCDGVGGEQLCSGLSGQGGGGAGAGYRQ